MNSKFPEFLKQQSSSYSHQKRQNRRLTFIDSTLRNFGHFIKTGFNQAHSSVSLGFFQQFTPGSKLLFLGWNLFFIGTITHYQYQLIIMGSIALLFVVSRIKILQVYSRISIIGFFFGFVVALPASLNFITPGTMVFPILKFQKTMSFWIYSLPDSVGFTREGILLVFRFFLRVTNSVALSLLVIYTTPFHEIIKSLRRIRVPSMLLMVITLSYKFIFILSATTEETFFALKSRMWNITGNASLQKIVGGRIAWVFQRSWIKYEEVFQAMVSRGYTGDDKVSYFRKAKLADYLFLALSVIPSLFYYCLK